MFQLQAYSEAGGCKLEATTALALCKTLANAPTPQTLYDEQSSAVAKQASLSDRSDRHTQLSPKTARPEPPQSQNKGTQGDLVSSRSGGSQR